MTKPHYYLMKSKKILRLEEDTTFASLPASIREKIVDGAQDVRMTQDEANWRVALFRDEIMEYAEYVEWLESPEAQEEWDYEIAN